MHLALYRKFRPETFDKMLGQEHIVRILTNQIRMGTVGHAYLLCGTRGTGKTTVARLLAKGVNCLADEGRPCGVCASCVDIRDGVFMDVVEIDAASNNGVDNIRDLKESVQYPPVQGRRKAYIIDEVHMLSTGAFNALLKTLEEPPADVMFILATTEPQKLPATILSRCLRLDFKRVPAAVIKRGMKDICAEIGTDITDDALALLAFNAGGSVRDGLSLLDQCIAGGGPVSRDTVLELLGSPGEERLAELTGLVFAGDVPGALMMLDGLLADGNDERQIMKDWIEHFRNLMLIQHVRRPMDVMNMPAENAELLVAQAGRLPQGFVSGCIMELSKTLNDARWSTQPRVLLEVGLIKMALGGEAAPVTAPVGRMPGAASAPSAKPVAPAPPGVGQAVAATSPAAATAPAHGVADAAAAMVPTPGVADAAAATAPDAAARPAAAGMPPAPDVDLDGIVAEISRSKAVFKRLEGRSRLSRTAKGAYVLEVLDDFTKKTAESAREMIEAMLSKRLGAETRIECRMAEGGKFEERAPAPGPAPDPAPSPAPGPAPDPAPSPAAGALAPEAPAPGAEEIARQLQGKFNIEVSVERE
ncbi:MAG: DNA polymerase III subunit gamma/tau [Clostridiales Family XIII bacterium]|jgi:DNA polymerase-3 subunit gamma/tau|nr:DNA polymerase III subunit gamma/tau [Clostridiales Family XIII bacterium]